MNVPTQVDETETFRIDHSDGPARTGVLRLSRGEVNTPVFMPVGTQASVKALGPDDLTAIGAEIVLANTYHLMLRPGPEVIESLGGVSKFMSWHRPVLTDSGGFQIYSLAQRRRIDEDGVEFRSHIDGSAHRLTPEQAVELQRRFGADICMALDECTSFDASDLEQAQAMERTHRWLERCIAAHRHLDARGPAKLFGICQGGFDASRRTESARVVAESAVDGCAIGGLSVGEPKHVMHEMLEASISALPWDRPRYLMGVGSPEDLWHAAGLGVDMFDCVQPSRVARHGGLYTPAGRINVRAARFRETDEQVDPTCDCYTCRTFSLAYLHHLYRSNELLVHRLGTLHNIRFLIRQTEVMREAISAGRFDDTRRDFASRYQPVDEAVAQSQRRRFKSSRIA